MHALYQHAVVNQTAPCSPAERVLFATELCYPPILLLAFISTAAAHSILTSRSEEELVEPTTTGPGGKPLPVTKRRREHTAPVVDVNPGTVTRRVFQYLNGALVLTFVADFATVIVHALQEKMDGAAGYGWWCGEERIVGFAPPPCICTLRLRLQPALRPAPSFVVDSGLTHDFFF
jgi:hypothetical protein